MKTATALQLKGLDLVDRKYDAAEFAALFHQHQSLVRSVIFQIAGSALLKDLLNDLVQEAFIRIWKGLPDFREDAKLTSWIYRVSANVAVDALRAASRQADFASDFDLTLVPESRPTSEQELANRQLVDQGLRQLSDEHRAVVVLALIHERPLAEIAEILGVSEGTVKSRLHYGKERFRSFLEEKGVKP